MTRAAPAAGAGTLAAVAGLVLMGQGLWGLLPGLEGQAGELFVAVTRAAVCALGIVVLAAQWERAARLTLADPLPLFVIGFALATTAWSTDPARTAQAGLLLLLAWVFAAGLVLRFSGAEIARMAALAGLGLVLAQLAGQLSAGGSVAGLSVGGGELGIALCSCIWAARGDPAWRPGWMVGAVVCAVLGLATADWAVGGALVGLGLAALLVRARGLGMPGLLGVAWLMVGAVGGLTLFALFLAPGIAEGLQRTGEQLGMQMGAGGGMSWLLGTGFGDDREGLVSAVLVGTGLWGSGLAALMVLGFLVRGLMRADEQAEGFVLLVGGMAGVCLLAPASVPATGLGMVLLLVGGAGAALDPARIRAREPRRRPLIARPHRPAPGPYRPPRTSGNARRP